MRIPFHDEVHKSNRAGNRRQPPRDRHFLLGCVRIEGILEKQAQAEFEAFFSSTSVEYQIVKANSGQSKPVESLEYLREKVRGGESLAEIPDTM